MNVSLPAGCIRRPFDGHFDHRPYSTCAVQRPPRGSGEGLSLSSRQGDEAVEHLPGSPAAVVTLCGHLCPSGAPLPRRGVRTGLQDQSVTSRTK